MACTGAYATVDDFEAFWCRATSPEAKAQIALALDMAANDIHIALAASDQCDCSQSAAAQGYLKKLNIVDAAVFYNCPCERPRFAQEDKEAYMQWVNDQMEALRFGILVVCAGETGANFPSMGWAEQSHTDFQAAEIVLNDVLRNA